MAPIPKPQNTTAQAVVRWREQTTDTSHRPHLGASLIGHACDRHLWMTFRWVGSESFDGRMLRLFDTGKLEEPRVYEELRGIGCEVAADDGTAQFKVSTLGGHFGGSLDGAVLGIPEAPKTWHVLEIKTHSDKLFKDLTTKGVREAKPMHWAQMQTYMHLTGMDRALYYAVNKNTDALHIERVEYDRQAAEGLVAKAERIIRADVPPQRLSDDPAWFECKFCRFHGVCHGQQVPEVNCRTCVRSTPEIERGNACWTCSAGTDLGLATLPLSHQRTGCDMHLYIPPLLEKLGAPVDGTAECVTYQAADGAAFTNGPGGFSSAEIRAAESVSALTDPTVQAIKCQIPTARLVGA